MGAFSQVEEGDGRHVLDDGGPVGSQAIRTDERASEARGLDELAVLLNEGTPRPLGVTVTEAGERIPGRPLEWSRRADVGEVAANPPR